MYDCRRRCCMLHVGCCCCCAVAIAGLGWQSMLLSTTVGDIDDEWSTSTCNRRNQYFVSFEQHVAAEVQQLPLLLLLLKLLLSLAMFGMQKGNFCYLHDNHWTGSSVCHNCSFAFCAWLSSVCCLFPLMLLLRCCCDGWWWWWEKKWRLIWPLQRFAIRFRCRWWLL